MQTCPTCRFESPLGAKFCRQCGAPIIAESEFTGASTRNYGRQEPAFAPAGSAPLPPSIGDVLSSDTARYQPPPPAPVAPQAFLTPSISTAPLHRKARNWRVFAFFLVLLVGIGLGAFFAVLHMDRPDDTDPVELARLDAQAAEINRQQEMADHIREAVDRAREAQDRVREAADRAREAAEQAAASGATLAPGNVTQLDLSPFEYPGAATANYSRIPGNEIVQMRSKDTFDAIVQHYQKKLGKPLTLRNEADEKRALFQSSMGQSGMEQPQSVPTIFVSIESDDENEGFWKITINRAPFQFPQLDLPAPPAALAPPAPVKP